MNTKLRQKGKNDFQIYFFRLMNNAVFGKAMKNIRNHGDIKLITHKSRRNNLVSESNYFTIIQQIFFQKMY